MAKCLGDIGYIHFMKGEHEEALEYSQRGMTIYEALGNQRGVGDCLHNMGLVYGVKREHETALKYYQRSLDLAEENAHPILTYFALTHISFVYSLKGDTNQALDYLRRSLAIADKLEIEWAIAYNFCFIGIAYHQKGALDIALPFFQSSLAIVEKSKRDYEIVRLLYHLIHLSLDQQKVDRAQEYLDSLHRIASRIPEDATSAHIRYRLAEALVLKQSPRMKEKVRAQKLLSEIVQAQVLPSFTLMALVALCDILLLELKATGEEEVWEEAKALIHQFYRSAHEYKNYHMVVHGILLKAKFATIDGELDLAQEHFDEVWTIIHDKKLDALIEKVKTEQREFEADFQRWKDLIEQHTSLKERLIQAELEDYIREAQKRVNRRSLSG
jgi:tetratricopeptide (TPR) repeat protein